MWITFEFFLNYVENTRNPEQVGIYLTLYSSVLDESVNADAEIYIIMIGTNDSKPYNWNTGDFKSELKNFVGD